MVLAVLSSLETFFVEDKMRFTSLLHCLWCTKKMAISERAETEMCFPSILLERRVSEKGWVGGGEVEEKSCKRSLKTVKIVCNLILSEDFSNI